MTSSYSKHSKSNIAQPRRLSDVLNQSNSVLAELKRKIHRLQHLNALLADCLDAPVLEHIQIASVHDEQPHNSNLQRGNPQLVLVADSPVWGHRIRYLAPTIIEFLHQHGELTNIHDTRIIVRPAETRATIHETSEHQGKFISERSAKLLLQVANELDNSDLAEQLRRLGQRGSSS